MNKDQARRHVHLPSLRIVSSTSSWNPICILCVDDEFFARAHHLWCIREAFEFLGNLQMKTYLYSIPRRVELTGEMLLSEGNTAWILWEKTGSPLTAVINAALFLSLFRIPSSKLWTKSPFLSCTCIGDPSHQYEHFIVVVHCKRMTRKSCFHVKFMMQNHMLVKHEHGTSEWYYPINLPFYQ